MSIDPSRPLSKSMRLPEFDYAGNSVYFITLCTAKRAHFFGEGRNGGMAMNEFGWIVWEEWERSAEIRREIELDVFGVMPNHFHALVTIVPYDQLERPNHFAAPESDGRAINPRRTAVRRYGTRFGGCWMDPLDRLLEHDRWATETLLNVSRELTDAQLDQPFDIGHRTLRATFEHMVFDSVEVWTAEMAGRQLEAQPNDRSMAALSDRYGRSYAAFAAVARRTRDEQRLEDTFVDHFGAPMTFGGAILMVVLHGEEHRTEARHILHRLSVPDVPEVDYGLWDFVRRGLYQPG
jgi:uncharacterized damage-inducible protein DinB